MTTGVGHGNAYLETLWEKISDDRYEYAEQRSPVAHFLMVRILTLVSFAAPERTFICLRRGRLRILEYECSVQVCVFGRCWPCGRPLKCRRGAPTPSKKQCFRWFSVRAKIGWSKSKTLAPIFPYLWIINVSISPSASLTSAPPARTSL